MRRKTRRALEDENGKLRSEKAALAVMVRAYMRSNEKLQDEVATLNASLDCTVAEMERWREIARKADERRVAYVRGMV